MSNRPPPPRAAAFLDLDKAVIAGSSTPVFARPFPSGGVVDGHDVLRSAYAQFVALTGVGDAEQIDRMRRYLCSLCAGWQTGQVSAAVTGALSEWVNTLIYDEAAELIEEHRLSGRDVVIVSASGSEVVEPIATMVGADHVIATRMAVDGDGRYTGELDFHAHGQNKVAAIREMSMREGFDLSRSYAYSNSAADLPMLEAVGRAHGVNPDGALRRECARRGWPVLDFSRPVPARERFPSPSRPSRPVVAAAAGAAATAAASVVWWVARRRDR